MGMLRHLRRYRARSSVRDGLLVLVILAVGAFLRLRHLRTVPGWYPDEGSWIAIASDLMRGQSAYMAFGASSFIAGRPPLFHWVLAGLFRLLGVEILWARLWTVSLGLLTLLLLYVAADRMCGRQVAMLAAGFYAVYPSAVVYSRLALTYNQLAPLYLLALYSVWWWAGHGDRRWLALAALSAGLALLTDLAAISLLGFVALAILFVRPRALLWALPLALFPCLLWAGATWCSAGDFFLQDVAFTLSRISPSFPVQVARVIFYRTALEGDLWFTLGGLGLLFQADQRRRWLAAGLFGLSLFVLVRNSPAFGQSSYFLIPLFPLAALGMGVLLTRGVPALVSVLEAAWCSGLERLSVAPRVQARLVKTMTAGLLFLFLIAPPISMIAEGIWLDYGLYLARLGDTLADPIAARQVADYVNRRIAPDDVVLASPTIAWLFQSHVADFQMSIAATGQATQHFPTDVPLARLRFDPRLDNATYVILDPLWRGWASTQMPTVSRMVREVEADWSLERTVGDFEIYRNPD